jgi:hypothetical protein
MNLKQKLILFIKVFGLTIVLLICYFLAAVISGLFSTLIKSGIQVSSDGLGVSLLLVFLIFLFPTIVLTFTILSSRTSGWKLILAIFLVIYGVNTIFAQIETVIFVPEILPEGMILKLFIMGLVMAGIFTPIAVLVLGKMKETPDIPPPGSLRTTFKDLPIKLGAVSIIYMLMYFIFGYCITWKNPLTQNYYGAKDAGNFFVQLVWIGRNTPWAFPFQIFRGLLLSLFVLPVICMLKGPSWKTGLTVGMLLIVWSGQLILPNPYISASVARVYMIESAPYHFVFGFFTGYLLSSPRTS